MTGQIASIEIAWGILLLLVLFRVWRTVWPRASWLDQPVIFFGLVFLCMFFFRLPGIHSGREINVDESQMLAQGMRYLSHPVPWRDVDGTTSGPLNSLLLSAPILAGAPASWVTSRTVLWATNCLTLLFIYLALCCFASRAEAQFGLLPTLIFYGFQVDAHFTFYSSEALPVMLLAAGIYLLCREWVSTAPSRWRLFLTGLISGCLPFTKLQASPLALFLVLLGVLLSVKRNRQIMGARKLDWPGIGWLVLGAIIVPVLLMIPVVRTGAFDDFWKSYILAPAAYTHGGSLKKFELLWALFTVDSSHKMYCLSILVPGVLLALVARANGKPKLDRQLLWPLLATIVFGILTVACIAAAGWPWAHYLLLLIPAEAMFFGLIFIAGKALLLAKDKPVQNNFPKEARYFMAACIIAIWLQLCEAPAHLALLYGKLKESVHRKSFVARRILSVSRAHDTMSVWGWMPSYYVETGLIPATRDSICHFIIEEGPFQNYYQQRYLNDLKREQPALFVDAVAQGVFAWTWKDDKGHESFPELTRYIDQNYSLWLSVHIDTPWGMGAPVRIYLLKQRMAEQHLHAEDVTIPFDASLAPD